MVDNASRWITRIMLTLFNRSGLIDKLYLNPENSHFAGGNNIAASIAREDSSFYLLLNSDVEIRTRNFLKSFSKGWMIRE